MEELCAGVGGVARSNVSGYNGGNGKASGGGCANGSGGGGGCNGSESKRVVLLVVEGMVMVY